MFFFPRLEESGGAFAPVLVLMGLSSVLAEFTMVSSIAFVSAAANHSDGTTRELCQSC